MTFDTETSEALRQPLDASLIKHRPGSKGMMLKYLSGSSIIQAANRIFGFGAWGYTVVSREHQIITDGKKGQVDVYTCDIELHVQGAAFPFPGDGVGIVNAPYTAESHEQARKTATTDALKRALRHYGDSFGLCLYSEDEYVDAGGTLVQVKDVHPGNHNAQPKRVVESARTTMLTTHATSNDSEKPVQGLKARISAVYRRAGKLNLFEVVQDNAVATQANFYKLVSELVGNNVITAQQITLSHLDIVEAYVNGKDSPQQVA